MSGRDGWDGTETRLSSLWLAYRLTASLNGCQTKLIQCPVIDRVSIASSLKTRPLAPSLVGCPAPYLGEAGSKGDEKVTLPLLCEIAPRQTAYRQVSCATLWDELRRGNDRGGMPYRCHAASRPVYRSSWPDLVLFIFSPTFSFHQAGCGLWCGPSPRWGQGRQDTCRHLRHRDPHVKRLESGDVMHPAGRTPATCMCGVPRRLVTNRSSVWGQRHHGGPLSVGIGASSPSGQI